MLEDAGEEELRPDLLRSLTQTVNSGELAQELLGAFGGNRGLAQIVRQAYDDAPTGGMARTRILADVIGIIKHWTTASGGGDGPQLEGVSDAELILLAQPFLAKTTQKTAPQGAA